MVDKTCGSQYLREFVRACQGPLFQKVFCYTTDSDTTVIWLSLQVHVHMQGQEALFSDNMPLKDVIVHLTKQVSAKTPREANMGTPFQTSQDTSSETGQGKSGESAQLRGVLCGPLLEYNFSECLFSQDVKMNKMAATVL